MHQSEVSLKRLHYPRFLNCGFVSLKMKQQYMEVRDTLNFVSESLGMENLVLSLPLNVQGGGRGRGGKDEQRTLKNRGDPGKKVSGDKCT